MVIVLFQNSSKYARNAVLEAVEVPIFFWAPFSRTLYPRVLAAMTHVFAI
jgi:hypothetical protein